MRYNKRTEKKKSNNKNQRTKRNKRIESKASLTEISYFIRERGVK